MIVPAAMTFLPSAATGAGQAVSRPGDADCSVLLAAASFPGAPRAPTPAERWERSLRNRPLIAVTGPDVGGGPAWIFTALAIVLAGGLPLRVTPRQPRPSTSFDGLIIGGGADVDPLLYGQHTTPLVETQRPAEHSLWEYLAGLVLFPLTYAVRKLAAVLTVRGLDARRDALEMRLLERAIRLRLPVLGICRGAQIINVFFGGSLYQDLSSFYTEDPETRSILPRKRIDVKEGSHLRQLLGGRPRRVNALHRQAIHRLGDGIVPAARDRNGIIQGIEHTDLPFVIGVQWHPEYLPQLPEQRRIFRALIATARQRLAQLHSPRGLR